MSAVVSQIAQFKVAAPRRSTKLFWYPPPKCFCQIYPFWREGGKEERKGRREEREGGREASKERRKGKQRHPRKITPHLLCQPHVIEVPRCYIFSSLLGDTVSSFLALSLSFCHWCHLLIVHCTSAAGSSSRPLLFISEMIQMKASRSFFFGGFMEERIPSGACFVS